ncbi:MAG: redox-sensing transcriptional repressor Rex [Acidimicrobiia bacterium]
MKTAIPKVTVQRLPVYLRCLEGLPTGQERVSSDEIAVLAGVNGAKVRKDLSYLGSYGVRGVGYEVERLKLQIGLELGLERDWAVVIVGVGNLGRALANYAGFSARRFRIVGLFDADPHKVGQLIDGLVVEPMSSLNSAVADREARIGIVTTPAAAAQQVAEQLADAGILSILNFAPTVIRAPEGVDVRRVDLSTELQVLSFYLHRQSG